METIRLQLENVCFSYGGGQNAADRICLSVAEGAFVGLIGPNGSGKSTVLKTVYRALTPQSGTITLDGEDLLAMGFRDSAKKMAVVGQENDIPFDFTVEEIVAMGRSPHKKLFEPDNAHDKQVVRQAMERLGMEALAKRNYLYLSGGEKQRAIIARAVAQESSFFVLDEPTNHLDISYQIGIFDLLKKMKLTVLAAIHDLNLAALYCDDVYVMKGGKIVLHGAPEAVFTPENIYKVYGVRASVDNHPETGRPAITFLPASE